MTGLRSSLDGSVLLHRLRVWIRRQVLVCSHGQTLSPICIKQRRRLSPRTLGTSCRSGVDSHIAGSSPGLDKDKEREREEYKGTRPAGRYIMTTQGKELCNMCNRGAGTCAQLFANNRARACEWRLNTVHRGIDSACSMRPARGASQGDGKGLCMF